jgi:hypothetical protein
MTKKIDKIAFFSKKTHLRERSLLDFSIGGYHAD